MLTSVGTGSSARDLRLSRQTPSLAMPAVILDVGIGTEDVGEVLFGTGRDRLVGLKLGEARLIRGESVLLRCCVFVAAHGGSFGR